MTLDANCSALITELGALVGIPGLAADARGVCRLLFDGQQVLDIAAVPAQARWLLSCPLDAPTGSSAEAGLALLMRANHLGAGFGGGWASVGDDGRVWLQLPLAYGDASAGAMLGAAETLLDHTQRWRVRLQETGRPVGVALRMQEWQNRI